MHQDRQFLHLACISWQRVGAHGLDRAQSLAQTDIVLPLQLQRDFASLRRILHVHALRAQVPQRAVDQLQFGLDGGGVGAMWAFVRVGAR